MCCTNETIFCDFSVSNVAGYINNIEPLNGTNFPTWKEKLLVVLGVLDFDYALREKKPVAPAIGTANFDQLQKEYDANKDKWEKSNRMALMIIKQSISVAIRGAIVDKKDDGETLMTDSEFMTSIEENFKSSSKTYASTLIMKMLTSRYDGQSGIREHIMSICDMVAKLKALEMSISDGFLVHFIMTSLPAQYNPFKISYNTQKGTWSISELISYCVEEEERQKTEKMKDVANFVNFGKGKHQAESGSSKQPKKKLKMSKKDNGKNTQKTAHVQKGKSSLVCSFCKSPKHMQKECAGFKEWLQKKGNDVVSFIDESFLANFSPNTWWIDSGATVHISNSLQVFHSMRTIRKGERSLRVADGNEVEVQGIGSFSLELASGFNLQLDDVLYVPSLKRNLISVSALDDSGHIVEFGNNKCIIKFNYIVVGLAPRQEKLYMLSLDDNPVMNVCDKSNKRKRDDETSSKLWHCRLGHISKGRMERLIIEEILQQLDFSDSQQCIDCVKGKYTKTIKKGATRSSGL